MKETVTIYTDESNHRYTKDSILMGIVNFTNMGKFSTGGGVHGEVIIGEYTVPIGDFDVPKALKWAASNCFAKSTGWCAKYVRQMLEAGGINTSGHPDRACRYGEFLPKIGFKNIAEIYGSDAQAEWSKTSAKPGDIAVMSHGPYGHICMWTGVQWVSDFVQKNMWVYGGNGTCHIFRYTK